MTEKGLGETRKWGPDRQWKARLSIVLGTGAQEQKPEPPPPQPPQDGDPQ